MNFIRIGRISSMRPTPEKEESNFNVHDNIPKRTKYNPSIPPQMQAIPVACQGTHLLASAPTGSGKTAAFLLPVLAHISRLQSAARVQDCRPRVKGSITGVQDHLIPVLKHPLALILGPTRELCAQIEVEAQLLARGLTGIKTALVVGGNSLSQQMHRVDQGCQVIIATPGRLIDVLVRTGMALDSVEILVMDEVDSMLEVRPCFTNAVMKKGRIRVSILSPMWYKSYESYIIAAGVPLLSFVEQLSLRH